MSNNDLTFPQALRQLGLAGRARWIGPWAGFVLALTVGRVVTGERTVQIDELVFGLPSSWLVAWLYARAQGPLALVAGALVAAAGLLIGLLA